MISGVRSSGYVSRFSVIRKVSQRVKVSTWTLDKSAARIGVHV